MPRHDLAYVRPGAVLRFPCGIADEALSARVMGWVARSRPLVVARQAAGDDELLLGLTLPASAQRQRVACLVRRADVLRICRPLAIEACLHRLPQAVEAPLAALAHRLADGGVRVGVYGSLAWEALSGEAYRHAGSDVDLICDIDSAEQLARCLAALSATALILPCGLDGEVRFPDGCAVAWRELAAAQGRPEARVLVKGGTDVGLLPVAVLMDQFKKEDLHV